MERLLPEALIRVVVAAAATAPAGGSRADHRRTTQPWRLYTSSSSSSNDAAAGGGVGEAPSGSFAAGSGHAGEQQHHQEQQRQEDFEQRRRQLLEAMLRHVPQHGWAGGAAAAAAAADLGLSPAAAGMLGSDAEAVQLFVADCNQRLEEELAGMQQQLADMDMRERLRTGLQLRLRMVEPYIAHWPQALSLLAQPAAAPRTLRLYADLADAIWHAAGDASTDSTWYTKRLLLTGAYTATELYMLTDCSPGFADTWAALDRRLGDVVEAEKAAEDAGSLAGAVSSAADNALAQLTALLRRPS